MLRSRRAGRALRGYGMPEGNDLRLPHNPQFEFLLNHGKTMREWNTVPLYVGIIAAPLDGEMEDAHA